MLVFAGWLVVAAVVTLLVLPFEGASSYLPRRDVEKGDFFSQYRPPQNAPKFSVAFAARMFAVAATAGIAVYQWYLAPNIVGNTDEAGLFGIAGAGSVVVVMAICTFVGAFDLRRCCLAASSACLAICVFRPSRPPCCSWSLRCCRC